MKKIIRLIIYTALISAVVFASPIKREGLPVLNADRFKDFNIIELLLKPAARATTQVENFSAQINKEFVSLSWATTPNSKARTFEIHRAVEGDKKGWKKIETRNYNGLNFYSFVDNVAQFQDLTVKYRLKVIDKSGRAEFSKPLEVRVFAEKHYLSQNYPNPFNPTTSITFKLIEPGEVSLKVYNILGNEVAVLVEGERPAGVYNVEFNAAEINSGLSSGIYFYKLETSSYIETKKMTYSK
jgi:hypothetical protein